MFVFFESIIKTNEQSIRLTYSKFSNNCIKEINKMPNLVHVTYDQTGKSKSTNALEMREMLEKAYEGRSAQYSPLKAQCSEQKN